MIKVEITLESERVSETKITRAYSYEEFVGIPAEDQNKILDSLVGRAHRAARAVINTEVTR